MFRNKILIRASPPSSSPFSLIPLYLPLRDPSSFNPIDLESLCCKLSRTWRLACVLHSSNIFVIHQRSQSESAARVVEELVRSLPFINVGVEEELKCASLVAKAVECGLRSVMLDKGWTCVCENSFVQSTFALDDERKHLCAINVRVQAETDDGFIFLVSPDVLWFKRHKISDLASSAMLERFESGIIVSLEEYGRSPSCTVLPSLYEGHVIGLSMLLPDGETFGRSEELILFKHGLALPSNCFLNIQFHNGGYRNRYPSAFVLQGSGLSPAPQTIRASKAVQATELFINLLEGWDFFSQGLLKVKEVSSLGTSTMLPVWKIATSALKYVSEVDNIAYIGDAIKERNPSLNFLQLDLDFRTPKPAFECISGEKLRDAHKSSMLSSKRILKSRVNCTRDGDSMKLAHVAQSNHSKSVFVNLRNPTEKKHSSAVDFVSEITTMEPECASERRAIGKKDVTEKRENSAKAFMIKVTTKESLETSVHKSSVADKKLTSAEDSMSGVTTAESDCVGESSVAEKKLISAEDRMSIVSIVESALGSKKIAAGKKLTSSEDSISSKAVSIQKAEDNMQSSSRMQQKKEEIEGFLHRQYLPDSTEEPRQAVLPKKNSDNEKNKEDASATCKKMKTKHCADTSDTIAKVMDYHSSGALQSLTVPELKTFLTTKKAKVGGKKEELIQRITALLA